MTFRFLALLLLLTPFPAAAQLKVSMVPPEGEGAKHWPRWRGPSGQGVVADGAYVDKWSPTENILWKVPVPGEGNSSPIVWGKHVFLSTAYQKGKRRSILCFDRDAKGARLWETFVPDASTEAVQPKNGWASGTPTTDGERVYAYFGNSGILCVDFKGEQVWHHPLPAMNIFHGPACSPLLYKDKVIVFQDHKGPGSSFLLALDRKSGKEVWKTPRKEMLGWGSPVAVTVAGKDQILVSSENRVYAYNPEDGKEIWHCGGNLVEVTPTPVVGHGHIYCCSGRAGPTLAIRPDGTGDLTKSKVSWKTIKGSPFIPSPLLYGDYLYMVNDVASVVTSYHAVKGNMEFQERCGEAVKHGFSASPIGVNGKVFFTNDDGETYVLKAGPVFEILHVNRLGEKTLATPALVDGKWYMRTEKHLWCVGK